MLDRIRQLEQAGRWAEIRADGPQWLAAISSAETAPAVKVKVLMILARAWEETAACPADYLQAQTYAHQARAAAEPDSLHHTWALYLVAVYHANLGEWEKARRTAKQFLRALPKHPEAEAVAPYVYAVMGHYTHYRRKPVQAVTWFEKALQSPTTGEFRERVQLLLIWSLAACGRLEQARARLPACLEHLPHCHYLALMAFLFAQCESWVDVKETARAALERGKGQWRVCDRIQIAEMHLLLKQANWHLERMEPGFRKELQYWHGEAKTLLEEWGEEAMLTDMLDAALSCHTMERRGRKTHAKPLAGPASSDDGDDQPRARAC